MGGRCNDDLSPDDDLDYEFPLSLCLGFLMLYLLPLFLTFCETTRYQILHF